jgi:hypothetical protein
MTEEQGEAKKLMVFLIDSFDLSVKDPERWNNTTAILADHLALAERRGMEEAAKAVDALIGKDSGNWNRAMIHAASAIRQRAKKRGGYMNV